MNTEPNTPDQDPKRWEPKSVVLVVQAAVVNALLIAFTVWAMIMKDTVLIERIWNTVMYGFFFLLAYSGGSAVLQTLSKLKFGDGA